MVAGEATLAASNALFDAPPRTGAGPHVDGNRFIEIGRPGQNLDWLSGHEVLLKLIRPAPTNWWATASVEQCSLEGSMNALTSFVSETHSIVGSCINCTTPANLIATLALILIGAGLAAGFERRKSGRQCEQSNGSS